LGLTTSMTLTYSSWQLTGFVGKPLSLASEPLRPANLGAPLATVRDLTAVAGSGTLPERVLQNFTDFLRDHNVTLAHALQDRNLAGDVMLRGARR
jgi:hypothetical protein